MQALDIRPSSSKTHLSASQMPSRSFLTSLGQSSNGGAESGWDGESQSRSGFIDLERASLERLRTVVAELFKAVNNALQGERVSAKICIKRAGAVLQAEPALVSFGSERGFSNAERPKSMRGGLAPWQIRRVTTHIEANLDASIRIKDLATLIRLSPCHFCRAFKDSFGDTPHGYLLRRRMERAQGLMLATKVPLGQIAAECGLADQAHFNRVFRRFVGESPGVWRRARTTAPA